MQAKGLEEIWKQVILSKICYYFYKINEILLQSLSFYWNNKLNKQHLFQVTVRSFSKQALKKVNTCMSAVSRRAVLWKNHTIPMSLEYIIHRKDIFLTTNRKTTVFLCQEIWTLAPQQCWSIVYRRNTFQMLKMISTVFFIIRAPLGSSCVSAV